MPSFSFLIQYLTKPRSVGAILPSSKYLARKMTCNINFTNVHCIAEYGAGTGVFTDQLLKRRKPDTTLLIFEKNEEFYKLLQKRYKKEPNLHIINDSAERIGRYLAEYNISKVDYVVSGLPFASLPREVSLGILTETKKQLKSGGSFITFQYSLVRKDFIRQFFDEIEISREFRNIPPAYIFCCKNVNNVL